MEREGGWSMSWPMRAGGVVVLLAAAGGIYLGLPARTPSVAPRPGAESVAALEAVTLGGEEQWILARGRDVENPVALFLHGGPGMPMMYLAHDFGGPLEEEFVVVHWDQPGAGKSIAAGRDSASLSVERILADAVELVDLLRDRFDQEKLFLVGHSWGSYLGMILARRHPERFHAFVGVGQTTDPARERAVADSFLVARARESGDTAALRALRTDPDAVREELLFRYGGELHDASSFLPLLLSGLRAPEYDLGDVLDVAEGSSFSSAHMTYDALRGPVTDEIRHVEIPVFLFLGRHDRVTPSRLAVEYLRELEAPEKDVYWFESSAHFPFFEEPDAFAEALAGVKERVTGGDR